MASMPVILGAIAIRSIRLLLRVGATLRSQAARPPHQTIAIPAPVWQRSASAKTDGFIGGGQIGYNYQFANSVVAGIEADIQGIASSNGSSSFGSTLENPNFVGFPIVQTATVSKRVDYLGTVRGRLGFLITPALLVYGTGGLAYGGVNASTSIAQSVQNDPGLPFTYLSAGSFSNSRVGWTAGGGLEWLFAPNWSVKAEYLYYDIGSVTYGPGPLVNIGGPLSAAPGSVFSSAFRNPRPGSTATSLAPA